MLYLLFVLVIELQNKIGDGCQVSFSEIEGLKLLVRVDWWEEDFHFQMTFDKERLVNRSDDTWLMAEIVEFAKTSFINREKRKGDSHGQ